MLLLTGCGFHPVAGPVTSTVTAKVTTETPIGAAVIDADGDYVIGRDIRTGVWHTKGQRKRHLYDNGTMRDVSVPCLWRIGWAGSSAHAEGIALLRSGDATAGADVRVDQDGLTFETEGCQAWQRHD